uniref:Uncharacterized protein n=1 Tax=Mycena chlorophos TaxID=658473 RepID=A0ABQ0KX14_MYCCL|nr:predicted protein [Mycena chlorophos]
MPPTSAASVAHGDRAVREPLYIACASPSRRPLPDLNIAHRRWTTKPQCTELRSAYPPQSSIRARQRQRRVNGSPKRRRPSSRS